jgi:hypothetical protein
MRKRKGFVEIFPVEGRRDKFFLEVRLFRDILEIDAL